MAGPTSIPFPQSSTPGWLPGEGEGRLVNAYVEKAGDTRYIRRAPGLTSVSLTGQNTPRGMFNLNGTLYSAWSAAIIRTDLGTNVSTAVGVLTGTDPVTWARNNKTPDPDLVVCRSSGGAYVVTSSSVSAYPDSDLPANVNSVSSLNAYLIFTVPDGRFYATDLNTTAVNSLSFGVAEAKADTLVRGISWGGSFYAMGTNTIEIWKDLGLSPFPLARTPTIIPVGLLIGSAIAGMEEGWDGDPLFVAHDGTVRVLSGYRASAPVSTPDVERFIGNSDVNTLEAKVYTFRGNRIWSLSSSIGTWEYNVASGWWHERLSGSTTRWRAAQSVKVNGSWYTGDTLSDAVLRVSENTYTEKGASLVATVESAPLKGFPLRMSIPSVFLDFTLGRGDVTTPNPTVTVKWSLDGAATWTASTQPLGAAGKYVGPLRVNRPGLASHHGLRVGFTITDPVSWSFMGAATDEPDPRAA